MSGLLKTHKSVYLEKDIERENAHALPITVSRSSYDFENITIRFKERNSCYDMTITSEGAKELALLIGSATAFTYEPQPKEND